jgi:hypothetical protein
MPRMLEAVHKAFPDAKMVYEPPEVVRPRMLEPVYKALPGEEMACGPPVSDVERARLVKVLYHYELYHVFCHQPVCAAHAGGLVTS